MAEKLEVLDLLISVLREHELRLEELAARLEDLVEKLSRNAARAGWGRGADPRRRPHPVRMEGRWLRLLIALGEAGRLREAENMLRLLRVRSLRIILVALLRLGEASAHALMRKTGMPEATVYRALKRLRELGLVEVVGHLSSSRRGGRRTVLYALAGSDVNEAGGSA
jgi:DNA-binding transcriptional ArsR family regulator